MQETGESLRASPYRGCSDGEKLCPMRRPVAQRVLAPLGKAEPSVLRGDGDNHPACCRGLRNRISVVNMHVSPVKLFTQ